MDDCDWLLSVEKACDWLRIEPGVTGNFLLGHPVFRFLIEFLFLININDLLLKETKKSSVVTGGRRWGNVSQDVTL